MLQQGLLTILVEREATESLGTAWTGNMRKVTHFLQSPSPEKEKKQGNPSRQGAP